MNIDTENDGGATIVRVREARVDAANSPRLKAHLLALVEDGQLRIGVDLSDVRLIDSSGLGALVTAVKRIGQNGCVMLWGLSREVKAVFELTQLYKVFEIFESEADAKPRLNPDEAD